MNRKDLKRIARVRLKEASILLKNRHYAGAYYLAGYCIECAIKACIAKQVKRFEFPDKDLANQAWSHDLEKLIGIAGLKQALQEDMKANSAIELNWAIIKDWKESYRYEPKITKSQATDFYLACSDQTNGILDWIEKRW